MLKTYELIKKLSPKLGEEEAKELVYFVEESRGETATKGDLEKQSQAFKGDLEKQSQAFKADLERQSQVLKAEFEKQIQTVKVDLIKWFFGFWVTLLIAIILKGWL